MQDHTSDAKKDKILVVDDDQIICEVLNLALSNHFEVKTLHSGAECLQVIDEFQPKLVILDIDMPGMNGYDTCRKLREAQQTLPIIFLSSCDTLTERLEAFDSGGDDFLSKPTDNEIVLRKVQLTIKAKADRDQIVSEKASFEHMAMTFLDSLGDSGVLQNYARVNFNCPDFATLMENTLKSARDLGLKCQIQFRFPEGTLSCNDAGKAGALEESVLTQVASLGRLFQFKKRLATNFEHVTIIILNMSDDSELAGRIRDNIAILAEMADDFVNGIIFRNVSAANVELIRKANISAHSAVEILRSKYRNQQLETRLLQNELVHEVEKTFIHLGLTDSQEHAIADVLQSNLEKILRLFEQSDEFEKQFSVILNALSPKNNS
jgi:CheY-like chemotaxis protein